MKIYSISIFCLFTGSGQAQRSTFQLLHNVKNNVEYSIIRGQQKIETDINRIQYLEETHPHSKLLEDAHQMLKEDSNNLLNDIRISARTDSQIESALSSDLQPIMPRTVKITSTPEKIILVPENIIGSRNKPIKDPRIIENSRTNLNLVGVPVTATNILKPVNTSAPSSNRKSTQTNTNALIQSGRLNMIPFNGTKNSTTKKTIIWNPPNLKQININ